MLLGLVVLVVIVVEPSAAVSEPEEVVVHVPSGVLAEITAADGFGNKHDLSAFDDASVYWETLWP